MPNHTISQWELIVDVIEKIFNNVLQKDREGQQGFYHVFLLNSFISGGWGGGAKETLYKTGCCAATVNKYE